MKPLAYLDNAATTPIRPEVRSAMEPFLWNEFGNPSSPHGLGRTARAAVEEARRRVATALGVEPREVVFTSGGTEADNLAVIGCLLASKARNGPLGVAVTAIEHKAVLEAAEAVTAFGGEAIVLPVDSSGRVETDALLAALEAGVALVSAIWVNNEIGVVQDVATIAEHCRTRSTPFHTDAVQALGKVPTAIDAIPITALTISGHKIGAPKGVGALIVRDESVIEPLVHGGGQQHGIRPGTENVAGIVGLGIAVELAVAEQQTTARHTGALRDQLESRLRVAIPDVHISGAGGPRAPHISNVAIPGTDSGSMIMHLDLGGICCSSGSACSSGAFEPSHVLTAVGVPPHLAIGALRFSFSKSSTTTDVDLVMEKLPAIVDTVRAMSEV